LRPPTALAAKDDPPFFRHFYHLHRLVIRQAQQNLFLALKIKLPALPIGARQATWLQTLNSGLLAHEKDSAFPAAFENAFYCLYHLICLVAFHPNN
jgi:hypothetical protein